MSIHTIDIKHQNFPGAHVQDDGTRHLNLDQILDGHLVADENTIDEKPATIISAAGAPVSLASNPRTRPGLNGGEDTITDQYFPIGWDANNYGRTNSFGPLTQGPFAFAVARPTIISAIPAAGQVALLVEWGDTVRFMGTDFRVVKDPRDADPRSRLIAFEVIEQPATV